MSKKPVLLCIMDGFGKNPDTYGNAIAAAKKPNLDRIFAENPMTYIGASGLDVGLPDGQMGNSEVGHTNIGAGETATPEQANEVCAVIRSLIERLYGKDAADAIVVQYGGSMNDKNAAELLAQPDVDGGLIGGASLVAEKFTAIVNAASAK